MRGDTGSKHGRLHPQAFKQVPACEIPTTPASLEDARRTWDPVFKQVKLYLGMQHGHQKHLENIRTRADAYRAIFYMTDPTLNALYILTCLILATTSGAR